jgi:hypothetical protein
MKRGSHRSHTRKSHKKGGAATNLPLKYFDNGVIQPIVQSGSDILKAINNVVRPQIGGRKHTRKTRRVRGGFVPSVMGNFAVAASKYITPIALFAGYKLMTRKRSHRK